MFNFRYPMTERQRERIERQIYGEASEITNRTVRMTSSHEVSRIIPQSEFDARRAHQMQERAKRAGV